MPEEPTAPERTPRRRRRAPSAQRFAAGALASFVAVFGVLALRVHDGDDPALAGVAKKTTTSTESESTSTSSDPYDPSSSESSGGWDDGSSSSSDSGDSPGAVSSTPGASTSAS